jgi:hypothetical protein
MNSPNTVKDSSVAKLHNLEKHTVGDVTHVTF